MGRAIVEQLLASNHLVRAMCRRPAEDLQSLKEVEIVVADVRDRHAVISACEGMDVVFHAAGVTGIWGPWKYYYGTNTQGTQHVIEGCRRHRVPRLVYTSSPSVTFDGQPQCGVDETAPYSKRWLCHYPHSKALAEQQVLAASGQGGLATCALRPHLIWGPGDRQLVPRLIERARAGRLRQIGDGKNLIDTVFVENAAIAHVQAAKALDIGSPVAGHAYFISQGEPVNCWDWINELLDLHGLPAVRRSISFPMAWHIGSACESAYGLLRLRREPPLTRFLAAQLGVSHFFDISAARRDFGYAPSVSVKEGMLRLLAGSNVPLAAS